MSRLVDGAGANTRRLYPGTPSGYESQQGAGRVDERRGGGLIRAWIQGRLHTVKTGCRNRAKDTMRHFGKFANRALVACAGKIFWGNCFEKNWGKSIIAGIEILRMGFRGGDGSRAIRCRGWGMFVPGSFFVQFCS